MISTMVTESEVFVRERTISTDSTSSDQESIGVPRITVDHVGEFEDMSSNQSSFETDNDQVEASESKSHDEDPGKDSGIETGCSGDDDITPPDNELLTKIINQVEFYFSDANILKDPFLLKHVRRNKEGYVSLKLIASFRKVKAFTKNWKVVTYSLRHSEKLEVNELGTKVRRRDPLPIQPETAPLRTVVALNLPFEKPVANDVQEMVSKYGEVILIRILKPDSPFPSDVKRYLAKCPEIGHVTSALIEFKSQDAATKAVQEMDGKNDWRGFKVIPLVQPEISKDSQSKPSPLAKKSPPTEKNTLNATKKRKNKQADLRPRASSDFAPSSCSESEQCSPGMRRRSNSSVSSGYLSSSPRQTMDYFTERRNSRGNRLTPSSSPCMTRKSVDPAATSASPSPRPWVQRRFITGRDSNNVSNSYVVVSEGVVAIREPRGPDGSNGFKRPRNTFFTPVISPLVSVAC